MTIGTQWAPRPGDGAGPPGTIFRSAGDVRRPDATAHDHDILTTAEGSPRLGIFVDFMRAADLARLLLADGPLTVLAPTEKAFLKLSLRERDALLANPRRLSRVMRGHVIAGRVLPPMYGEVTVCTIDGETLVLRGVDGVQHVNTARIVQTNIRASNGTIHAIDSVLY
jgi:uncharacterized surface protein with fasciclin (FAS1) repeats